MKFTARDLARRLLCWPLVLAFIASLFVQEAAAGGEVCRKWQQNRLLIGSDLQARRFVLEGQGEGKLLARDPSAEQRKIFYRTFSLSLDVTEPIGVFNTSDPQTVVLVRDKDRSGPLSIPVFFVGRSGESLDDVIADAKKVVFGPSGSLGEGDDFAEVEFHLLRGGSLFGDIKPFFTCGLPGIILCNGYCPADSVTLARSLTEAVAGRQGDSKEAAKTGKAASHPDCNPKCPTSKSGPEPAESPAAIASPASKAERQVQPSAPEPKQDAPGRFELTFEGPAGVPLNAREVLEVEGGLKLCGVPLSATETGLTGELPHDAIERIGHTEALQEQLRHYKVLKIIVHGSRLTAAVDPLYVRAADLTISISDNLQKPVSGCSPVLDVLQARRLGKGWPSGETGLTFARVGPDYLLNLPNGRERPALFINAAGTGDVARLYDAGHDCGLEGRPMVTVAEIKSLKISRSLRKTGPLLFALLSTDSAFSSAVGKNRADRFWSGALDALSVVSAAPWERKFLARAQSLGLNPRMLQDLSGDKKLAGEDERGPLFERVVRESRLQSGPRTILESKPLERIFLDKVLRLIRSKSDIIARYSAGQEAIFLGTGSVKSEDNSYCPHFAAETSSSQVEPQWLAQARKAFILEVWDEKAAIGFENSHRATLADGAPPGIYACAIASPQKDKIEIFGLLPAALSETASEPAFAYLKERAIRFMKP